MVDQPSQGVFPSLVFKDARAALALYADAFGAVPGPVMEKDGKVLHASFELQGLTLFLNDDMEMMPRHPSEGVQSVGFYVYSDDVDAMHARAVGAGMEALYEPTDMFWGDRTSVVKDRFGYCWTLATRKSDPSPEEQERGRQEQGF